MTIRLTIDGRQVAVEPGASILEAARRAGADIPTLCHRDGLEPFASCFLCVVEVEGLENLVPSCAAPAHEGMAVTTDSEEIRSARRTALELLLSDHVGDCEAPCRAACPAGLDIPGFLRAAARGLGAEALAVVRERLALPAVLGRICPAYCERVCRRRDREEAVAIRAMHGSVAECEMAAGRGPCEPPECGPATGRKVVVVGAGPAGLAAAFHLRRLGHACIVLEAADRPGGLLRHEGLADRLPAEVLDAEVDVIARMGAEFRCGTMLGVHAGLDELRRDCDAVLLAFGAQEVPAGDCRARRVDAARCRAMGLNVGARGLEVDGVTFQTSLEGVFAAGEAVTGPSSAVRAMAAGRLAAGCIARRLCGQGTREPSPVSVHMGKLSPQELDELLRGVPVRPRARQGAGALPADEARREAARCLECDCAARETCGLRLLATRHGARPAAWAGERRRFHRDSTHPEVIYESGKCIQCGLCVRTAQAEGERMGLTFLGRSFTAAVGTPFGEPLVKALTHSARKCAEVCPTGALALRRAAAGLR